MNGLQFSKYKDQDGSKVVIPTSQVRPLDILLGRGKPFQSHKGNQRYLQICDLQREKYMSSGLSKSDKGRIVLETIHLIRFSGPEEARFLKRLEGDAVERFELVDEKTVYNKVSHALRDVPKSLLRRRYYTSSQDQEGGAKKASESANSAKIPKCKQKFFEHKRLLETAGNVQPRHRAVARVTSKTVADLNGLQHITNSLQANERAAVEGLSNLLKAGGDSPSNEDAKKGGDRKKPEGASEARNDSDREETLRNAGPLGRAGFPGAALGTGLTGSELLQHEARLRSAIHAGAGLSMLHHPGALRSAYAALPPVVPSPYLAAHGLYDSPALSMLSPHERAAQLLHLAELGPRSPYGMDVLRGRGFDGLGLAGSGLGGLPLSMGHRANPHGEGLSSLGGPTSVVVSPYTGQPVATIIHHSPTSNGRGVAAGGQESSSRGPASASI